MSKSVSHAGGRHIVIATAGSLGDLHPFLAIGQGLQQRGHRVTVATSAQHRELVQQTGLGFRHMRPDPETTPAFHARYMHPTRGGRFVYEEFLGPAIRHSYTDLARATQDADLLLSQSLMALAAPLVAARTRLPWISAVLQPMAFFSLYERPSYLPAPWLASLCGRSPVLHARVMHYMRKHTMTWVQPVLALREELGMRDAPHPLYEGQHSPDGVLALFSPLLGQRQPDWPEATVQTGAALYQPDCGRSVSPETDHEPLLRRFLAPDSRPLAIFTLSSAASNDAGDFYRHALAASQALGLRALLVMGGLAAHDALPEPLPTSVLRVPYAAFEQIFPHAAVIVHSGGVATSFKALQAGKPQLIVPHAHDQLDNALRLQRLGVAGVLPRQRINGVSLRRSLQGVLADPALAACAARIAPQAQAEDGVRRACEVIEGRLAHA